jgi:membrane fusion protein (multidrug efflux system)
MISMKSMLSKHFLLLALSALLLLSAAGCGDDKKEAQGPAPLKVVVAESVSIPVPVDRAFNATLSAKETIPVRARANGYLKERLFEEGALVNAGDVLFKLDDRELAAGLKAAQAETATAKAAWDNNAARASRYDSLAQKGSVSEQEKENMDAMASESKTRYDAAKAQEEQAELNLGYATVEAPVTGYIDRSQVDPGGYVAAGTTLLANIYGTDPIRAEFSITDRELALFQKIVSERGGDPKAVSFRLETGDERTEYPFPGVLEMTDPTVDSATGTLGVRAVFPNPEHHLRPGMFTTVTGSLGEREAVVIPEEAVLDHGNGKAVYVVDGQNVLSLVSVETGKLTGGNIVIEKGLAPGQTVVVQGLVTARPGLTVEIVSRTAPPAAPAPASGPPPDSQEKSEQPEQPEQPEQSEQSEQSGE